MSQWEAIGPFPSGMREHPYLASPLHAYTPGHTSQEIISEDLDVRFARQAYDERYTIPSDLATGGRIAWARFKEDRDGWVIVRYPKIRYVVALSLPLYANKLYGSYIAAWKGSQSGKLINSWEQLRSEHGWSALQYAVLLRRAITIPPTPDRGTTSIRIDAHHVCEYAFIPSSGPVELPVVWYQGDIYDFASSPSGTLGTADERSVSSEQTSNLSRSIALSPGEYIMLVRAIYEIRLFGDPKKDPPSIRFRMHVQPDRDEEMMVKVVDGLGVVPDVVDGKLMGDWLSVPLRASPHIERAKLRGVTGSEGILLDVPTEAWLVRGGQTRPFALRILQTTDTLVDQQSLDVVLHLEVDGREVQLHWTPKLSHRKGTDCCPFMITFHSPAPPPAGQLPALVSFAMVVPPKTSASAYETSPDGPADTVSRPTRLPPVILALHGAGVDIRNTFWADAIPERGSGWAILPPGKTEWGEDWHGGSMDDAWAAREAVGRLVSSRLVVRLSEETLLIGHSNGGQGAWHLAARYPDRVSGVIVASGYGTIQEYVPYTNWTSRHYTDPSLLGILQSSLSPYANDLHLTNITHIPVLAIHGAEDDNVPPRHGRTMVNTLIAYSRGDERYVKYIEVPKKGHWWMEVLKGKEVDEWISQLPKKEGREEQLERGVEITVVNPDECGGRAGVRVLEVDVPGRMARMTVQVRAPVQGEHEGGYRVTQRNVRRAILPDGKGYSWDGKAGLFQPKSAECASRGTRRYGPMIRILATQGPLHIVIGGNKKHLSLALRLAHNLYLNHRVDVAIMSPLDVLLAQRSDKMIGNMVFIGRSDENDAVRSLLQTDGVHPPVKFVGAAAIRVGEEIFDQTGTGLITLWPHPTDEQGLAMIIAGVDQGGLERAARLFPVRTGVPVPDWVVTGSDMDRHGAGGLLGAGFWGSDWGWNNQMSWTAS